MQFWVVHDLVLFLPMSFALSMNYKCYALSNGVKMFVELYITYRWLCFITSSQRSLRSIHWPIPNPIKHLRSAKSQKASGKAANRLMTDKMRPDKYMVIFLPNLSLKGPTTIPPKKNPTKIMDDPMVPYKPRSHTKSNYRQISQAVIRSKDGSNINYNSNKKTFYFKK